MEFHGDIIWGDDEETTVFADARKARLRLIFRFSLDVSKPSSLPSRVVTCFHDIDTINKQNTFSDREEMRKHVWSSIDRVWQECAKDSGIGEADVVVEIKEGEGGQLQPLINHETKLYQEYKSALWTTGKVFPQADLAEYSFVEYDDLDRKQYFDGRSSAALTNWSNANYVFKGLDMRIYLEDPSNMTARRDMCYHEITTIAALPAHKNLVKPTRVLVVMKNEAVHPKDYLLCGTLSSFLRNGSLDAVITAAEQYGTRIDVREKAKWCYQICSVVHHIHYVARTYHQDLKPGNILIDDQRDVLLADWEQCGAAVSTLAPEADGSYDVKVTEDKNGQSSLVYIKYKGKDRRNTAFGVPAWNVFPIWPKKAVEAAEVFSLGRTLWLLLEQITWSQTEDMESIAVTWSQASNDIPPKWRTLVQRCLESDPNRRISMKELTGEWEAIWRC